MCQNFLTFSAWLKILLFVPGVACLLLPSYISDWHTMDTGNSSTLKVTFNHSLGERPIYCDVQVKSLTSGYIYPGIGSGFVGNSGGIKAGVIFYYNNELVVLMGPVQTNVTDAYIISTGDVRYTNENPEQESVADVRVRLWLALDFPPPSKTISSNRMKLEGAKDYKSEKHDLGHVPVMTIVQVLLEQTIKSKASAGADLSWVTQAQGSYSGTLSTDVGGTLFGVDAENIYVWTVGEGVFSWCGGWWKENPLASECIFTFGTAIINTWSCLESSTTFNITHNHSINVDTESDPHSVSSVPFNPDTDLLIVRSETLNGGDYVGSFFDGIGAALLDSLNESISYSVGGLVYAIDDNSKTLHFWHAVNFSACDDEAGCACIVRVPEYCANEVTVHVVIVQGMSTSYPEYSPLPMNAYISDRRACLTEFTCNNSYLLSEGITVSYLVDGNWTSTDSPPVCVYCNTVTIDSGTNVILKLHKEMFKTATYECMSGYTLVSGDLERNCHEMGPNTFQWNGTEPVCGVSNTTTKTTSTTKTTTGGAVCFNFTVDSTPEQIAEAEAIAEEISKNLTVDSRSTSSYIRSLTSAEDNRQSAVYLGLIGYLVFGIVFGLMFVLDGLTLVKFIQNRNTH